MASSSTPPPTRRSASFLHPALAPGASDTDVGIMDGDEVLLQYDSCGVPMTLQPEAGRARESDHRLPAAPPAAPVP